MDSASRPRMCFWVRLTVLRSDTPRSMDSRCIKNRASRVFFERSESRVVRGIFAMSDCSKAALVVTYDSCANHAR